MIWGRDWRISATNTPTPPISEYCESYCVSLTALDTCRLPAEDAEHEVEHEEGSDDDKWDKVDPIEQTPQSVVSLEHTKYLDE